MILVTKNELSKALSSSGIGANFVQIWSYAPVVPKGNFFESGKKVFYYDAREALEALRNMQKPPQRNHGRFNPNSKRQRGIAFLIQYLEEIVENEVKEKTT